MRMRLLFAAVLLLLAFSGIAAADEWTKDFNVGGSPKLNVDTNDGSIRIVAGSGSRISARVSTEGYKISPAEVRIVERQNGDSVELIVRVPTRSVVIFASLGVRIEVTAPANTHVDLRSGDGRISVSGIRAPARLHTGDGTIEVRNFAGPLNAHSGDGRIEVEGLFEDLQLDTSDGSIDAEVRAGSRMAGRWVVRTGDGMVRLRLPRDFNATLDAHTGDGRITVELPLSMNTAFKENDVRGKLNGGGNTLQIRSGDGSIRVSSSGVM